MTFSTCAVSGVDFFSMGETMAFFTFRDVAMSIRMTADAGNCPVFAGIDGHLLVLILVTGTAIF